MVVVEFRYDEMKRLVDIPLEQMVEGLSNIGAPCEYEKETKKILAELTPNRPDWYSMEGLARALRSYYKKEHPKYTSKKSNFKVVIDPSVSKIRPYTMCAVVNGLEFNDQRIRDMVLLQEKLIGTLGRRAKKFGIGVYPLQTINFPIKYTTMKPEEIRYVPLGHEKEMSAKEILELHKKGKEHGHIIQDFTRYPVFVDSKNKIMCLIPVVNSAETGRVDEKTKDIFIEVSGTDVNACKAALNILVCTFADMGGKIFEVLMEYNGKKFTSPDLKSRELTLDLSKINNLLGIELSEKKATALLKMMGYDHKKGKVMVPPYRADVLGLVDVIEDIAIAYGYNNFEFTTPNFFSSGVKIDNYIDADRLMRGMGFFEIKTFILTNKEKLQSVGYEGKLIEISNPNSVEFTVVRPTLTADILDVFANNKMSGLPQRYYEIGLVKDRERRLIFGVMDKKIEFSDVRGYLQTLTRELGLSFTLDKKENVLFDEISCVVVSEGKEIGIFGKVRRSVLEKFGLAFDVYLCELEL
jgi:phenylalanyl-tRNA synthetase beta chain